MRDFIRVFMWAIKTLIIIVYMILIVAELLLQEIYILMKLTAIIIKFYNLKILLIMSGSNKIMSSLQIRPIFWMLASHFLSLALFIRKVLKCTPILISHAARHLSQISQIQWEMKSIMKKMMLQKRSHNCS